MTSTLKIALFTGTRAEFGLLKPVARACEAAGMETGWIAGGMHLLESRGSTITQVRTDKAPIWAEVPCFAEGESHAQAVSRAITGVAEALEKTKPCFLVVLGDRYETFAATQAASYTRVPTIHLHGGDRANSGHLDESMRHAISRLASLHAAASPQSAERLRKFGEEDWRIRVVGAPGLDRLKQLVTTRADEITAWRESHPGSYLLVILHPVSGEETVAGAQAKTLFEQLDRRPEWKLAVYPNNDPGGDAIMAELKAQVARAKGRTRTVKTRSWMAVPNLNDVEYAAALSNARALVGNSSAGIIEAPLFGIPMVHVGRRNLGREQSGHAVFVDHDARAIEAALDDAVSEPAHERARALQNPYGDGHAGERAAAMMAELHADKRLLHKLVTY
jgi:GDP/UDP-N,N'-diacetylbacillosamine 2-epimerase (hydrolysing)